MMMTFRDRSEAGRRLAERLGDYASRPDVIVLALPRGGVPVAYEIAEAIEAPLDLFVVRKLGVPGQEELAMGAIASGGVIWINEDIVKYLKIPAALIDEAAAREQRELERRERAYRGQSAAPDLHCLTVILVDDGLATGATMRAAISALRKKGPERIVVAVPVATLSTYYEFKEIADDVVSVLMPEMLDGVGRWYEDFSQTTDEEVRALLDRASRNQAVAS